MRGFSSSVNHDNRKRLYCAQVRRDCHLPQRGRLRDKLKFTSPSATLVYIYRNPILPYITTRINRMSNEKITFVRPYPTVFHLLRRRFFFAVPHRPIAIQYRKTLHFSRRFWNFAPIVTRRFILYIIIFPISEENILKTT